MGRASRQRRQRRVYQAKKFPLSAVQATLKQPELFAPPDFGPISPKLTRLVSDLVEEELPLEGYRRLIDIGVISWNLSVLGGTDDQYLTDFLDDHCGMDAALKAVIECLCARKSQLFADDDRLIIEWQVDAQRDGGYSVLAAALSLQ